MNKLKDGISILKIAVLKLNAFDSFSMTLIEIK